MVAEPTEVAPDAPAATFDERLAAWREWQASPWGRLRYDVVEHLLVDALRRLGQSGRKGPRRVVDLGGGDGADALRLARHGHRVTVVDYSAAMLDRARQAAQEAGLQLSVLEGSLDALPEACAGFDAALCHNVLQYRADPEADVARVVSAVRPGGLVSVIAPNPAAEVLIAAVRRPDPAEALALLGAPTFHTATFQADVRRVEADEVAAHLSGAGCVEARRFGVRCVTDLILDDERKHDPAYFARLRELELALSTREPFLRTARFWHLLARRA